MAEVLGLVASGISVGTLAAQITSSVVKLKSYWDQVHDAPEEVSFLIEQTEALNCVLVAVENDLLRDSVSRCVLDSTSFRNCCRHCQKAAERLKALVDSISTDLEASSVLKRKRGLLRMVSKQDKIVNHEKHLHSAMSILLLAYQSQNA